MVSPSGLQAGTTLYEPKNGLTRLELCKLAKIIIFEPLEAHCALTLAGTTQNQPNISYSHLTKAI